MTGHLVPRAVDDLIGADRAARNVSRERARHVLEQLASHVASSTLAELQSAPEVGARLGVTSNTVKLLAREHGLGHEVGKTWVFVEHEISALSELLARRTPRRARLGMRAEP